MAKFKGFTDKQTHQLLSELGYDGPVDKEMMDAFVAATPSAASMLGRYNEMARDRIEGRPMSVGFQEGGEIVVPDWVDEDSREGYIQSIRNRGVPRKPNMREIMQKIGGKSIEEQMAEGTYNDIAKQASELLYGVVGANEDTRDFNKLMEADDFVTAVRQATAQMYNDPQVTAENLKRSTTDVEKAGASNATEYLRVEGNFDGPSIVETPNGFTIVAPNGLSLRGGYKTL